MDQEPMNEDVNPEPQEVSRRDFLRGAKGWSGVVAGLALALGFRPESASGWINTVRPGWINRSGWVNRGGWVNARGGWLNAGGGGWVNRAGWINGGGGWLNRGGWVNRGGWINNRVGGSWINRW